MATKFHLFGPRISKQSSSQREIQLYSCGNLILPRYGSEQRGRFTNPSPELIGSRAFALKSDASEAETEFFSLSLIRYAYPHEKKVGLNCPFGNRTEKKNIPVHMVLHMI